MRELAEQACTCHFPKPMYRSFRGTSIFKAAGAQTSVWRQNKQRLHCSAEAQRESCTRRGAVVGAVLLSLPTASHAANAKKSYETMEMLKGKDYGKERQKYSDYTRTESGLQYQDIRVGQGEIPPPGATVAIDWDGYTIGEGRFKLGIRYYSPSVTAGFAPQNGVRCRKTAKGGSFGQGADRDLYKFTLNGQEAIPAVEEAVAGMKPGGIRRLIVPVELGYPENNFKKRGPKPNTFSGERALDFVLGNKGLIDKTLLIDVELVKVFS